LCGSAKGYIHSTLSSGHDVGLVIEISELPSVEFRVLKAAVVVVVVL